MKRGACMIPMSKKKKLRIVLGTYACALIAALGIFSYVSCAICAITASPRGTARRRPLKRPSPPWII